MQTVYWLLLVPFILFVIALELIGGKKAPDVNKIIRRVLISIILLLSLDECMSVIRFLSEGISGKISGFYTYDQLCEQMGQSFEGMSASWFKIKEATIYIITVCSYMLAYVGVYMSNALVYFVWSILYVCAPLMILMYVCEKTAYVTGSLYKGLINVAVWRIFYSIMGVLLLKFATVNQVGPEGSFLKAVIVNLCVAVSMLFTPFAVKSLLSDGMSSMGAAFAMIPSIAMVSAMKKFGRHVGGKILGKKGGNKKNFKNTKAREVSDE